MDGFESARRDFIRKLGLTLGAGMVISTAEISAQIMQSKDEFALTAEQNAFMQRYEQWMDEFIVVIRRQKEAPEDIDNNHRIMALSEEAKSWQTVLHNHMTDDNFARHYMIATERMTREI